MNVMLRVCYGKLLFLCLFMELQNGVSLAAYKGDKTTKTTGNIHHVYKNETKKEKRFMINLAPKRRVVYSFVTDRNRYVPRRPRLYRAYIVKRPLIARQTTTENAEGRQSIPYIEAQPTFSRQPLLGSHTVSAQPVFYYQEPTEQEQGPTEFEEPFEEEEAIFPEVPQEYSGTWKKKLSQFPQLSQGLMNLRPEITTTE